MAVGVRDRAREAFKKAYHQQMIGHFDQAITWYRKSIDLNPTPEAHTFLAWNLSCLGRYEPAIDECLKAVAMDPDYGNPLNDIGAYLIELGRCNDAVPWLRKACWARRYDCKQYSHFNLGRVYEDMGRWAEARAEYRSALAIQADYGAASRALLRLIADSN